MQFSKREHRLIRFLFGGLSFGAWLYCLVAGSIAFATEQSLAGLAIAIAGAAMLVVQFKVMRNPKWPQRLW